MQHLRDTFEVSERHACELIGIAVSTFRYESQRSDEELRKQLVALAREKPRFGYRRLHVLLGRDGVRVNHKRSGEPTEKLAYAGNVANGNV